MMKKEVVKTEKGQTWVVQGPDEAGYFILIDADDLPIDTRRWEFFGLACGGKMAWYQDMRPPVDAETEAFNKFLNHLWEMA